MQGLELVGEVMFGQLKPEKAIFGSIQVYRPFIHPTKSRTRCGCLGTKTANLADLMEVIHAIMELHQITLAELEAERQRRRQSRGSFEKRLKLLWTE